MPMIRFAGSRPVQYSLILIGEEDESRVKTQVPKWRTAFTLLVILIAVIIISSLGNDQLKERAGVVIATTALLWCTEAMPLMITALMPAILFPFAGVLDTKQVSAVYWNYISMLMLGTFLMAESVEACGLHKRIALAILSLLGRSEALLLLGSMLVAWKLSMFMSNTATTAMMLPIIGAIIESLRSIQREMDRKNGAAGIDMGTVTTNGSVAEKLAEEEEEERDSVHRRLILSIPYGASIGGIATLTGTPPNLVFKSNLEKFFPNSPSVDFGKWMAFCYPISFLLVITGWHVLVIMYARHSYVDMIKLIGKKLVNIFVPGRFSTDDTDDQKKWKQVNSEIQKKYRALGPLRFPEVVLFCLVIILVILWLFRDPAGLQGWSIAHYKSLVQHDAVEGAYGSDGESIHPYLKDAWIAIVIGVVLFNIPTENPLEGTWLWKAPPGKKFKRSEKLLTMETVMKKTPWDVLILLGGGYAIAEGCESSGLSQWLGDSFGFLIGQNNVLIAMVICFMVACLTEVASNTASTTLLMPVLAPMSKTLNVNPLFLMISGTISASLAFCLPSATGPNALVFTFKEIKVIDMLRTGVIMNILSVLVVVLGVSTWTLSILGIENNEYIDSWEP
ncbi:Na(+)/citrate cotransporter-like [Bolinopsis microptera]|uniref:Na(+)/citrate cotransporter-like n=1 Tax=Bolinopsis microptera TaxID=2820187 RepID=UPI0030792CFC